MSKKSLITSRKQSTHYPFCL